LQRFVLRAIFRKLLFIEAKDITHLDVLFTLIEMAGIEVSLVNKTLNDGTAMAALMFDYQQARAQYL